MMSYDGSREWIMILSCLRCFGAAGKVGWVALAALLWVACSGKAAVDDGTGGSTASSSGQGGSSGSCDERILPVACNDLPPECAEGRFPESDGSCWTGECLDCVDGCQRDSDCVVVRACGCYYHEGCSWAETSYRAALLDECVRPVTEQCTVDCPASFCNGSNCPWCDADDADCINGVCQEIVNHMCE